jgi:hypothetical protein
VNQWVDQLTDLVVAHGFHTFILSADSDDQLTRFTQEVVPAVQAQVAAERT